MDFHVLPYKVSEIHSLYKRHIFNLSSLLHVLVRYLVIWLCRDDVEMTVVHLVQFVAIDKQFWIPNGRATKNKCIVYKRHHDEKWKTFYCNSKKTARHCWIGGQNDENFMEGNVVSRLNHGQTLRILVLEVVASNISNSSGKSMTEIIYAK